MCIRDRNGLEAVEKIEQSEDGQFGMILMDIHMPVMDGLEATRKIRGLPSGRKANIPIIAMTADAFAEDIEAAKAAGMNSHLAKPLDIPAMMRELKRLKEEGVLRSEGRRITLCTG